MTTSAMGERQMFPVQTKQIRYVIGPIVSFLHERLVQPVDHQSAPP